jgi:hypothetical protein
LGVEVRVEYFLYTQGGNSNMTCIFAVSKAEEAELINKE